MTKWDSFYYESNSGRRKNFSTDDFIFYRHWVPPDIYAFERMKNSNESTKQYAKFDSLLHVTSFSNACQIFEDGGFEQQLVKDSSVVNQDIVLCDVVNGRRNKMEKVGHPLANSKILWYGPYTKIEASDPSRNVLRYGNVAFNMTTLDGKDGEGLIGKDIRYYLVEIIDYLTQSACRILVTKFRYPELREYNPENLGGPWYYNKKTNTNYHLVEIVNSEGKLVLNSVEFMREEFASTCSSDTLNYNAMWISNHHISYKKCMKPRQGVVCDNIEMHGNLKLAIGILAFKLKRRNGFPPQKSLLLQGPDDYNKLLNYLKHIHDEINHQTRVEMKTAGPPNLGASNPYHDSHNDRKREFSTDKENVIVDPKKAKLNTVSQASDRNRGDNTHVSCSDSSYLGTIIEVENDDTSQAMIESKKITRTFFNLMENAKYCDSGKQLMNHFTSIERIVDSRLVNFDELMKCILVFYRTEFFHTKSDLRDIYREILRYIHPTQAPEVPLYLIDQLHEEVFAPL